WSSDVCSSDLPQRHGGESLLKATRFGAVFRLFPPLERLDQLNHLSLVLGFPTVTLGVLLGSARRRSAWRTRFRACGVRAPFQIRALRATSSLSVLSRKVGDRHSAA